MRVSATAPGQPVPLAAYTSGSSGSLSARASRSSRVGAVGSGSWRDGDATMSLVVQGDTDTERVVSGVEQAAIGGCLNTDSSLREALAPHLELNWGDGLYTVSMDHSPSEQLDGRPSHTTVLVASPAIEHSQLAHDIASRLRPRGAVLSKWSKARGRYRRGFWKEFCRHFGKYPVYVFAVSASETAIRSSEQRFVEEFGLSRIYKNEAVDDRRIVEVGPIVNMGTGEKRTLRMSENRALMVLFIAHFVRCVHQTMYEAANSNPAEPAGQINWNFYGDKFPGDFGGDMETLFVALTSRNTGLGRILWGAFRQGDQVETDLLVDNLAGILNANALKGSEKMRAALPSEAKGGFFYWELWNEPE